MRSVPTQPAAGLTIEPGYQAILRANGLGSLDALFGLPNNAALNKPGLEPWRERLRITLRDGASDRTFYLKRFRDPPPSVRRDVGRAGCGARSVAGVEWNWMQRLTAEGICCTEPVAFGEEIVNSREGRSAVLLAEAPGRSLETWVREAGPDDVVASPEMIDGLADLVRRFHGLGYVHRDLYLSHIFYKPTAPPPKRFRLIDLQRVRKPATGLRRWIVKDLAALNYSVPASVASRTDRLRWLTRYLGLRKLDATARRLVYRVVGKTRLIASHDARRAARTRRLEPK